MQNLTLALLILAAVACKTFSFQLQGGFYRHSSHAVSMKLDVKKEIAKGMFAVALAMPCSAAFALEQQYKLPPIDRADKNRCVLSSSSIGQANAARDKLYDLRECDLKGQNGAGKDMSGMIGAGADFSGINFKEAQLSKAFNKGSKFEACDFTNAVLDRIIFDGSSMKKSVFKNAVLSGTTFTDADLSDTDFSDAYLGPFDLKNLCGNPTLQGTNPKTGEDTRESAGCAPL